MLRHHEPRPQSHDLGPCATPYESDQQELFHPGLQCSRVETEAHHGLDEDAQSDQDQVHMRLQ